MPYKNAPLPQIERLYKRTMLVLTREINQLVSHSIADKLPCTEAKDLRDYIKLLGDLRKAHKEMEVERKVREEQATRAQSLEELEKAVAGAGD